MYHVRDVFFPASFLTHPFILNGDLVQTTLEGFNVSVMLPDTDIQRAIPAACNPDLVDGRFFMSDFVEHLKILEPISYEDALQKKGLIQTWLAASISPSDGATNLTSTRGLVRRARMASRTLGRYCKNQDMFHSDHVPEDGCPGDAGSLHSHSAPTYS
jgi:hypothetical protein